jgi:hypothetical protein
MEYDGDVLKISETARVQSQISSCEFCDGQSGTESEEYYLLGYDAV